jgi:hypothetical protein
VQEAMFDEDFDPAACQIITVRGTDLGMLSVEDKPDEIFLANIEILPEWQCPSMGAREDLANML